MPRTSSAIAPGALAIMGWTYYLDEAGDAPIPPGYHLVEHEVEFLRKVFDGDPLFIRGPFLCSWAREFCEARDWLYEYRKSSTQELRECCPELDRGQVQQLALRLGEQLASLPRPLQAVRIAAILWPEFAWDEEPGPTHAAHWLLWLIESNPAESEQVLLRSVSSEWRLQTSAPEAGAYTTSSMEEAWDLLTGWLRVRDATTDWQPYPLAELPGEVIQGLRKRWRKEAVASRGEFFERLLSRVPQENILRLAAETTAEYFSSNPQELSGEMLQRLHRYLTPKTRLDLSSFVPPEYPGEFPEDVRSATEWFRDLYLPFRQWEVAHGTDKDHAEVRDLAARFGRWYLNSYLHAIMGGSGSERLSWSKAASLGAPEHVTLLMVLDGLGYFDSEQLQQFINDESDRLTLDAQEIAFSPLPTITDFAKPSLLKGLNPARALDDAESLGSLEKKDSRVVEALIAAEPGGVVIWSLQEPDKAYHDRQEREAILEEVRGRLQSLAGRLIRVAHEVPAERQLKVVISTDHGRLLGDSERNHSLPPGMKGRGRAAWGALELDFPASGYVIEDDIVYLHAGRFGLHVPCAVSLSDESFLTADGKGGVDLFAHGGLYPEEVLIPWLEFTRDRSLLDIEGELKGRGVAGSQGELRLSVNNPSELTVQLTRLEISRNDAYFDLTETVDSMSSRELDLVWVSWPSKQELENLQVKLRYALPGGEVQTVAVVPSIESEELYAKDDILSDFGGLDEL